MTDTLVKAGLSAGRNRGISVDAVRDVVETHDQAGKWNYIWLAPYLGCCLWVDFLEPAGPAKQEGKWRHYSKYWWTRHGSVVSHDPDKLVEEHVKFFVGPDRSIDLRFYFETPAGYVYWASPEKWWYELEAAFFKRHGLGTAHHDDSKQLATYINKTSEEGLAPHWGPEVLKRPVLSPPPLHRKSRRRFRSSSKK